MGTRLRKSSPPAHVQAVLALLEGRRTAASKFPDAARLFIDRAAAEQASLAEVARYTAGRLRAAGGSGARIGDLGCGAGADTLALAKAGSVVALDIDEGRLAMLRANADVRRVTSRVEIRQADLSTWAAPEDVSAVWLDPSRRDGSGRRLDPDRWTPPLNEAIAIASRFQAGGIKLAPGIDVARLPPEGEVEFVSLRGRLVEAVLWLGAAARPASAVATSLPGAMSMRRDRFEADLAADVRPPGAYLYDPDPGIGRAGLVRTLARDLEGWQLNEEVAYVSSDKRVTTPWARRFRIIETRAFSQRGARDALARAGTGRVEVMRRGAPIETNALERELNASLSGAGAVRTDSVHTIALTRIDGRITMLLCARDLD